MFAAARRRLAARRWPISVLTALGRVPVEPPTPHFADRLETDLLRDLRRREIDGRRDPVFSPVARRVLDGGSE
jgi:hypothetical protein